MGKECRETSGRIVKYREVAGSIFRGKSFGKILTRFREFSPFESGPERK
jgi:hypothetical protein